MPRRQAGAYEGMRTLRDSPSRALRTNQPCPFGTSPCSVDTSCDSVTTDRETAIRAHIVREARRASPRPEFHRPRAFKQAAELRHGRSWRTRCQSPILILKPLLSGFFVPALVETPDLAQPCDS